jgi:hypothetical protein
MILVHVAVTSIDIGIDILACMYHGDNVEDEDEDDASCVSIYRR